MARNRVLSFMSQLSGSAVNRDQASPSPPTNTTSSPDAASLPHKPDSGTGINGSSTPSSLSHSRSRSRSVTFSPIPSQRHSRSFSANLPYVNTGLQHQISPDQTPTAPEYVLSPTSLNGSSPTGSFQGRQRSNSRPSSMVQSYNPPLMDINEDTIPELQPIFNFLNGHANKLYSEGYFLKLDDQNTQGRPNPDRTWTECFAQLVGTVLSLWDAAELDAAGEDGEVLPKFINLTDASIKMIESLPTRSNDEQPLQNILSISTAGRNRYLLHFNSHHSLVQWTAGIRLAIFEQSTLQEAYTGALIAAKGKTLNNIALIMDRAKFKTEEWVRVRFGAGVPWRRCWMVISPPDEKEYQKMQKDLKKRSPYDRSHVPILKGDIKFYDTKKEGKKQKKAKPIASLTDAYAAYAIYPQSKSLIDASSLIKIEGNITIHSDPPSSTEGFVFIMPEVPAMVSGFEMLLRSLFPTWDTFGLYGRPGRLAASVLDSRSLMFGMPKHKSYGYLEILDVSGLIATEGSSSWSEREWRKKLKELTATRMATIDDVRTRSRAGSRSSKRLSIGAGSGGAPAKPRVNFADDSGSTRSSRSMSITQPAPRMDSAPPAADRQRMMPPHSPTVPTYNSSDSHIDGLMPHRGYHDAQEAGRGPSPPLRGPTNDLVASSERFSSSDDERAFNHSPPRPDIDNFQRMRTPEPVHAPPAFSHAPQSRPQGKPYHSPEMRRANSRLSSTTLAQLAKAGGVAPQYYPEEHGQHGGDHGARPVPNHGHDPRVPAVHLQNANPTGMSANSNRSREAVTSPTPSASAPPSPGLPPPDLGLQQKRSKSPLNQEYVMPGASPLSGGPGTAGPASPQQDQRRQPHAPYDPRRGPISPGFGPGANYRGPPPPGRGPMPPSQGPPSQGRRTPPPGPGRGPLANIETSPPVHRKPLPERTTSLQRRENPNGPHSPTSTSSLSSLRNQYVDENALAQIQTQNSQRSSPDLGLGPGPHFRRKDTMQSESSRYDDTDSVASPDYASTRKSSETQESVDRPRAGVLRTVGDVNQHPLPVRPDGYVIPEVNFGRTLNYGAAAVAPGAAPSPGNSQLPNPMMLAPQGKKNPADRSGAPTHVREESSDTLRRNVAWQPGAAAAGLGADRPGALTPEQFVQQRAAAGPMYSHQRTSSGNLLASAHTGGAAPPPMKRNSSYDMLQGAGGHSRSNSMDMLSGRRSKSPGPSGALAGTGGGESSSHLSAREQEHLARVTGGPLINMAGGPQTPQSGGGLVGAIAARERERQQMKDGVSSQAVQQAIYQRQHHQQQQQMMMQQQQAYGMGSPTGPMNMVSPVSPMSQMSPGGGAPSMYAGSMGMGNMPQGGYGGYQPPPVYGPMQGRPPMPPSQGSYGSQMGRGPPQGGQAQPPGGGWMRQGPRQGHPQQMDGRYSPGPNQGMMVSPQQAAFMQGPALPGAPGNMARNMMQPQQQQQHPPASHQQQGYRGQAF